MGAGDPPVITIEDDFQENYAGGDHIVVKGKLRDYNQNEHLILAGLLTQIHHKMTRN